MSHAPRRGRQSRGGRGKHPPHLKGREIGLFYAQKYKAQDEENSKRPLAQIYLSGIDKNLMQSVLESNCYKNTTVDTPGCSYDHVQDSTFKRDFLKVINETIEEKLSNATLNIKPDPKLDEIFYQHQKSKLNDPKYIRMLEKRKKLPSFKMKDEILKLISNNKVVVISGETGCGKTTQVAQFILDDYIENSKGSVCRILCTQPRRISAIAVAERVAEERAECLGNSVGYQIRLERRFPRERGSICFCTTGVVLKLMETDPSLSFVSHLILDEIHERDVMSDFILALIKQIIPQRRDLKIILMSATLNSEKFSKYYNDAPHLNIPGFTYPVKEFYLEDAIERTGFVFERLPDRLSLKKRDKLKDFTDFIMPFVRNLEREGRYCRNTCIQLRNLQSEDLNIDLILALLIDICQKEKEDGAILVFVTGFAEISQLHRMMDESGAFPAHRYLVFPLHSLMPTIDQRQIFEPAPTGKRKIIIATNIAETSITIDDVVFVIDCGKIKISNFDVNTNTETLAPQWVSLANASQRKGRAGRVQPGICFHLYSRAREMVLEQYQLAEILRKRLEDVILTAKVLQLGRIETFFQQLIDPPNPDAVLLALDLLKQMNALDANERLTPLGFHLAKLPIAPQLGKMILFGAIFSCLDPILSVAATLDFKDPFQLPLGREQEANRRKYQLANGMKSDHLLYCEVLRQFEDCGSNQRKFCWDYFLSSHTLKLLIDMKQQFMQYLNEMNFVATSNPHCHECNKNSDNVGLVKAVICAGLYPNISIARLMGKKPIYTPENKKLDFHLKSVLAEEKYFNSNLLVYYRKIKSTKDYIHDGTLVAPLPVIFFGHNFRQTTEDGRNLILIHKNVKFQCSERTGSVISDLRERFNWFLEYKISHPGPVNWEESGDEMKLLKVIMQVISCEDMDYSDDSV